MMRAFSNILILSLLFYSTCFPINSLSNEMLCLKYLQENVLKISLLIRTEYQKVRNKECQLVTVNMYQWKCMFIPRHNYSLKVTRFILKLRQYMLHVSSLHQVYYNIFIILNVFVCQKYMGM